MAQEKNSTDLTELLVSPFNEPDKNKGTVVPSVRTDEKIAAFSSIFFLLIIHLMICLPLHLFNSQRSNVGKIKDDTNNCGNQYPYNGM